MQILYCDQEFVVCVKPVGMDSEIQLPEALKAQCAGEVYPLHRLDKNVAGVMVYARTGRAAAALSKAIQEGHMCKEYLAMVHGTPDPYGDWQDLLFKDSRKNKVFVVQKIRAGVKPARLEYRCLVPGERSLVHVRLHTGRSHQIRVQFASRKFPLVGDHKYGSRAEQTEPMLFSCRIRFPYHGKQWCFQAFPDWAQIQPDPWADMAVSVDNSVVSEYTE